MGLLDGIEKLITEHGSASILRERIALVNDKYSALESENNGLRSENETLKYNNTKLQEQARNLENQLCHNTNPHGYVCDHCGSSNLKRTGSRPDPTFGELGVKEALFICVSCRNQSAFSQNL
ncbi:hypothetical protein HUU62_04855 [Rhodoferax sp. 4810]|nr:hypothetical protein [Rhodoferax jenense]